MCVVDGIFYKAISWFSFKAAAKSLSACCYFVGACATEDRNGYQAQVYGVREGFAWEVNAFLVRAMLQEVCDLQSIEYTREKTYLSVKNMGGDSSSQVT